MSPTHSPALHLTNRFTSAVDYARTLHVERRKGSDIPYMAHLLGVAALVMAEAGHAGVPVTEDMVIAALLHDAVEDHGGRPRLADIEQNFGANVARLVEGLTDSFSEDPGRKGRWDDRKMTYIDRLKEEPADVQLISAADKLYNAKSMLDDYRVVGPELWKRFHRARAAQLWYFNALIEVFKARCWSRTAQDLERVVAELTLISAQEER